VFFETDAAKAKVRILTVITVVHVVTVVRQIACHSLVQVHYTLSFVDVLADDTSYVIQIFSIQSLKDVFPISYVTTIKSMVHPFALVDEITAASLRIYDPRVSFWH